MMGSTIVVASAVLAASLAGCASYVENVKQEIREDEGRETAIAIRANVTPEQVTVSNSRFVERIWYWHAAAAGADYDCSARVSEKADLIKTVCVRK